MLYSFPRRFKRAKFKLHTPLNGDWLLEELINEIPGREALRCRGGGEGQARFNLSLIAANENGQNVQRRRLGKMMALAANK